MKRKIIQGLIVGVIICLALGLRLYKLTTSPPGFYTDESSIAYNAWSIVETGKDEHEKPWPMFFEAYGEWKLPVYIYSVVIAQLILGAKDITVRLPAVIYGSGTVLMMYLFIRQLLTHTKLSEFIKTWTPVVTGLLVAVSPWHLQFSRPGFEVSSAVFFLTLGLWVFFMAKNTKSTLYLILAIVSFVVSLYAYNSSRIVVPVILFILICLYFRQLPLKAWLFALILGLVVAWPFINFAISPAGMVRARQISIIYQPQYQQQLGWIILKNYLDNLSPLYLFDRGDPTIGCCTPFRMALLYPMELPFFLIGLLWLGKNRNKELFLMLSIFLVGLVPPAVATLWPHALRGVMTIIGSSFISGLGVVIFWEKIRKQDLRLTAVCAYLLLSSVFLVRFLQTYHGSYMQAALLDWQTHFKLTSRAVRQVESHYDRIYFSEGFSRIELMWDLGINPRVFQEAADKNTLGKYHFEVHNMPTRLAGRTLLVTAEKVNNAKLIETVTLPNGSVAYRLWEL